MDKTLWKLEDVGLAGTYTPRLRGITVEIGTGVTAVLGPSGAGKTSLLDILVGFEEADEGRVSCTIPTKSGHSLPFYWVPQSGGLWPHLRVREHLERVLPSKTDHGDIARVLASLDLTEKAESYPDELSQGERSRLSVARALVADAAVLVMDEPLAHVDTTQRDRYWAVIRSHVARKGAALVFATHSPKTVLAEAERVICLREGRLLYDGTVGELYWHPTTKELAECLGECNWLEPEDAELWLGQTRETPLCLRPEQLTVTPIPQSAWGQGSNGAVVVQESRFKGDVAEVELRSEPTGERRRIFHRPSGDTLRPGDRVTLKILLLVLVAFVIGCGGGGEATLEVKEVNHWSMPPDGPMIPAPRSIAIGQSDEVIVLDNRGRVLVFDPDGKLLRQWRMPEVDVGKPEGVCMLADGRIAVADTHYSRVVFFDQQGALLRMFGRKGEGPGEFCYPVGITADDKGNLYVCEYGGNDRVQKFTSDGGFLLAFGSFGTGVGQFQRPSGLVWREGKVYVADAINNRIQVFSDGGKFLGELSRPGETVALRFPYDIALARDGALYVVEYAAGRITKIGLDGHLLGRFGTAGVGDDQFRTPWGIAVDSKLRLRVADTGNRRIVELKL